jgi:hypothetical protein
LDEFDVLNYEFGWNKRINNISKSLIKKKKKRCWTSGFLGFLVGILTTFFLLILFAAL